ncbi:hypothetical protein P3342_009374 [Pyrenophora teres f. teres]|nr:hypothetical protein P3342_009374 [Pyrenophora teres f. teres]
MANPSMAPYQDNYQQPQHMPMNAGWSPQVNQQSPYHPATSAFNAQNGPGNRPMSAPHQAPMPGYPYGQFPQTDSMASQIATNTLSLEATTVGSSTRKLKPSYLAGVTCHLECSRT